ncbi:MAG: hypothetical protein WD877_01265 [Candidatus Saccharimonadales bacterium]
MAEFATKKDVQQIVDRAVDDLSVVIQDFSQRVDDRFNKIEAGIAELNNKYDWLVKTLDKFLRRLGNIEADNAARDAQLARYERWLMQIAEKTGVKLKY